MGRGNDQTLPPRYDLLVEFLRGKEKTEIWYSACETSASEKKEIFMWALHVRFVQSEKRGERKRDPNATRFVSNLSYYFFAGCVNCRQLWSSASI
jgi:hypothetical protein